MKGKDFVAKTKIYNSEQKLVADEGETCERVDPQSLPWLLEGEYIAAKPQRKTKEG